MPSLGKSLGRIALAATMVIDFDCKHKNITKTQLLASMYHTFLLANRAIFWTRHGFSYHIIDAASCVNI
jgi:hypothetical protein